ncbi:MAG: hypothetical protein ACTSQH_07960 [Candidatus Hodarchaeales archaeon]
MESEQEKISKNGEMTRDTNSETKMQKIVRFTSKASKNLGAYMLETLKEMFNGLRHPEFSFAISGIVISVILILISLFFFLGPYILGTTAIQLASFVIPSNPLGVLFSIIIAFAEIYLWFLVGMKVTPKAAHYLVDNKVLKLVFTKGHVHYLEYVPVEKRKIAMPHILNKYIALIIAWVSLSAFLLQIFSGLLSGGDPSALLKPGNNIFLFLVRTIVMFILVPIVFTLVYPVGWMLVDAKLKAYNNFTKLNWLVGKKVVSLTAGIITIGSIVGLGATVFDDLLGQLQLIIDLVIFCIVNVSLIVVLIAIFYNVFFQGAFYRRIIESIEVGFGISSVTLVNEHGDVIPEESSEEESTLREDESDDQDKLIETTEDHQGDSIISYPEDNIPSEQEE